MNLADIRSDYRQGNLRRADLLPDPIQQFRVWMEEAIKQGVIEPTAMSLATASAAGEPLLRTVLLKGIDETGFTFYTNLGSRKAEHLAENTAASLLFPWLSIERQVIVQGRVQPVSRERAEAYFASRPRDSRLAAWASHQSAPLENREELETSLAKVVAEFGEGEVPLPPFWGGYTVVPTRIEFWQGGANRLHDRFEYTRSASGGWEITRLSP